jgi:hypothetical protein
MKSGDDSVSGLITTEQSRNGFLKLKDQYQHIIGGFAGFLPGGISEIDKGKVRKALADYLAAKGYDPGNTLIVSGGTKTDGIDIFYEVAGELGYQTASVLPLEALRPTSVKGGLSSSIYDADHIYIEDRVRGTKIIEGMNVSVPGGWGSETDVFNNIATELFVFGGGGKIAGICDKAALSGKPVNVVKNIANNYGEIGVSDNQKVLESAQASAGNVYDMAITSGSMDVRSSLSTIPAAIIEKRLNRSKPLKQELSDGEMIALKQRYKHVICEATFAGRGIYAEDKPKVKELLRSYLEQFSRRDTLIMSGGEMVGGMSLFQEVARELGFKTACAVSGIALEPERRDSMGIFNADYLYIEDKELGLDDRGETVPGGWGSTRTITVAMAT